MEQDNPALQAALSYLDAGLCALPARLSPKMPALPSWKTWQTKLPTEEDLSGWFAHEGPVCLLTGAVSGNLEMIDFDQQGELFDSWVDLIEGEMPGLLDRLVIEQSQSGGFHVVYRSQVPVCGNRKLTQREVATSDDQEVTIHGKTFKPRRKPDGSWAVVVTLIETRGEAGLFVCAPSPGYELVQGSFENLPVLSEEEREVLLEAAWSLNEHVPPFNPTQEHVNGFSHDGAGGRPGDVFNERGDVREVLERHGWTLARPGENEYWRRPGKSHGWSATLKNRVFYVFTSNAAPFEPDRGYSPFATYALLEHDGDFNQAASTLQRMGYGKLDARDEERGEGIIRSPPSKMLSPLSARELLREHPDLREPVIDGLLRRGETMNVISAPKMGKSWLVIDLALSVATGRPWLDFFPTSRGDVLIIDNELHRETSAHRLPKVAQARGIDFEEVADRLFVQNLRGQLQDIFSLGEWFRSLEPGRFRLVILDAFYRFLPINNDENDNGTMAGIYNHLDSYTDHLQCCFVLIHHTSKGNQSGKALTDVGAGAGSQSRATDTHLVLRPHEEEDVVVLDAAVRSWPPVQSRCLRWAFPVWEPEDDLDPTLLRMEKPRKKTAPAPVEEKKEDLWTPERFVETFLGEEPQCRATLLNLTGEAGLSQRQAVRLLQSAEHGGLVFRRQEGRGKPVLYATRPREESE